jgi:serine/threonine protein kinase
MSYCINPKCPKPSDPLNDDQLCRSCGSQLLLQERYRVKRQLGESSFSKIYEVEDCSERPLLKILKVLLLNDAIAVALFRQEARVLNQLHHPGIPAVNSDGYFTFFAKDRYQPLHCLVMEKVAGVNLEQWQQQQNQPLSQTQALDWLRQLLETLHYIHQQLYFHRDIQPSNIMLTPSGQLVLINFGSAREVSQTSLVKINGGEVIEMTSPGYTPQEQANGKAVPQSDFFALGRTFVALLTGKSPSDFLEDPRNGQLLWQHRAPQVSQAVTDLIDDLMATMPENRPHNAQMILQRRAAIDHTWQPPFLHSSQPEFTESLVSLQLEAWIHQQRSSSRLHRFTKNFGKFKKPLLIGGILCSLGLAGTQLPRHLSSLKEPFSALSNNSWLPLKK